MNEAGFHFDQKRVDDTLILWLHGPLLAEALPRLAATLDALDDSSLRNVHLDMADVSHLDSRGIGALVGWHRHFLVRSIDFRIFNVSEPVFRVFQVCNLTSLLNLGPEPASPEERLSRRRRMLSDSFEYGQRLLAALGQGVIGLDPDDRILFIDATAEVLVGEVESRLLDRQLGEAIPLESLYPDKGERRGEFVQRALRQDGILREECRLAAGGEANSLALTVAAIVNGEQCTGAIVALQDISARVRTEEALSESERRYRLLADHVSDVIWTTDMDLNLTYISPSIERLRDIPHEEFIGNSVVDLLTDDASAHAAGVLRRQMELEGRGDADPDRTAMIQLQTNRTPGKQSWIEIHVSFLRDTHGKPIGLLGVSRDITERKRVEEEKISLQDQLLHAQKMEAIGTLAGGVAHDFNNLLTGVLGHASLILSRPGVDQETRQSASVIEEAAKRGAELTTSLLGFARRGALVKVPVGVDECIRDLVRLLTSTFDRRIEIRHDPAPEPLRVLGDPTQLHHGLLNLALNARDAMPEGGTLTFRTERVTPSAEQFAAHPDSHQGPYAVLSVGDTGEGIPVGILGRIFEPFFTTREVGRGSGMGLAVVYGIAEHHNGWIEVASEPGRGSTFRLFLPLAPEAPSAPRPPKPTSSTRRILVVDDEEIVRTLAARMLARLGYDPTTAADGVEALEIYRRDPASIDLVILDMVMPRMGGLECLKALRRANPDVRVILSSGYSRTDTLQSGREPGVVGFAQKPYRLQDLSNLVAGALA